MYLDSFKHTQDRVRKQLWERDITPNLNEMPLYHNMPNYIVDNPFVVAYHDSLINYHQQFINCEVVSTAAPSHTAQLGWAIQKRSPLIGSKH